MMGMVCGVGGGYAGWKSVVQARNNSARVEEEK